MQNAERRMKNEEIAAPSLFSIPHSAFCVLHSMGSSCRFLCRSLERAGVVRQLRDGDKPVGARLNLLRPGTLQCSLGRENVENTPDATSITILCHVGRLLGSTQEVTTGTNAVR